MKKFKALICSFGLAGMLLTGAACGDDPVKDMEKIVDEMCACKDVKCLEGVQKKMEEMGKKYADTDPKDMDAETMKKLTALGMKAAECGQKIMTGGGEEKEGE